MQDIHIQIGDGGGDRQLRPHHHQNGHSDLHGLKCPRCDSGNTKFCYYNNYNLSQPRYFCKGCRRYWTKGGVLRNVPVGGGCRKAKRSKMKAAEHDGERNVQLARKRKSRSNSSSDCSSLTATTTAAVASTTTATKSAVAVNPNSGFDDELLGQSTDCGIFSEIGNFSSLMASSGHHPSLFGFNSVLDPQNHCHQQLKFESDMTVVHGVNLQLEIPTTERPFPDQSIFGAAVPPPLRPSTNCLFGPLDWQPSADQGLFDLPNTVDQAYWPSQTSPWTDPDQPSNLYLP